MTLKEAILTGVVGVSALAMAAPAARAEDFKEANPEVEKIRAEGFHAGDAAPAGEE